MGQIDRPSTTNRRGLYTVFWFEKEHEREKLDYIHVDEGIILKLMFYECDGVSMELINLVWESGL
jgi:hypothetical protein